MEKLVKAGKCKAIGVSNMSIPYLEHLLAECEIVPAVNQVCRGERGMADGIG